MPAFTGAEASATACPSHGRRFSLLPPPPPSLPLEWRTPSSLPLEGVRGVSGAPSSLPLEGFAALNDTPVACQIREPTDPQGDRCPHIPAASAATYPLRCFAPQWARFDNRHSISAPAPILSLHQRQRRKRYKRSLNRHCYPLHFMRECIPPNLHDPQRAKGPLDRRSKRLSFPHFFLRRKKCGRRRPPPRQGKIDSPPQRRNPPRARGSLNRRFEWFSLVTFF